MQLNSTPPIARQALWLGILTILGPASGFMVDIVLALRLGLSPVADGYRIGLTLILLGQVTVGFILPNVVLPAFVERKRAKGDADAWRLAMSLANLLLLFSFVGGLAAFLAAKQLAGWLGPGLSPAGSAAAAYFLRWFGLALIPFGWSGVMAGVLQAYRLFWIVPVGQCAANLCALAGVYSGALPGIAAGVVAGSWLSFALYGLVLLRLRRWRGLREWLRLDLFDSRLASAFWQCLPFLVVTAVGYLAVVAMNRALSNSESGSVAAFGYGWKALQVASLMPGALGTVLFPRLAHAGAGGSSSEFQILCSKGVRMGLFLSVPMGALCFALQRELIESFFQRGAFSSEAVARTAAIFGVCVLALPANSAEGFLQKGFYALGSFWRPNSLLILRNAAIVACCPWVAEKFGARGIAWQGTILGFATAIALAGWLWERQGGLPGKDAWRFFTALITLGGVAAGVARTLAESMESVGAGPVAALFSGGLFGMGFYLLGCSLLRLPEARAVGAYGWGELRSAYAFLRKRRLN